MGVRVRDADFYIGGEKELDSRFFFIFFLRVVFIVFIALRWFFFICVFVLERKNIFFVF